MVRGGFITEKENGKRNMVRGVRRVSRVPKAIIVKATIAKAIIAKAIIAKAIY